MKTVLFLTVLLFAGCYSENKTETATTEQKPTAVAVPVRISKAELTAARAKLTLSDIQILEAKTKDALRRINSGELQGEDATAARVSIEELTLELAARH